MPVCLSAWQLSAAWEVRASSLEACTHPNHPLAGWRMPTKFSGSLVSTCNGAHRESAWGLLWADPRERSWKGRGTAGPITALLMACEKGPGACLWGKGRRTPAVSSVWLCRCPLGPYAHMVYHATGCALVMYNSKFSLLRLPCHHCM